MEAAPAILFLEIFRSGPRGKVLFLWYRKFLGFFRAREAGLAIERSSIFYLKILDSMQ